MNNVNSNFAELGRLLGRSVRHLRLAMSESRLRKSENLMVSEASDLHDQILEAIGQLSEQVPKKQSLEVLLRMITDHLLQFSGATTTFVHLVGGEDEYLELMSQAGEQIATVGQRLQPGAGMAGMAWESNEQQYISDYQQFGARLMELKNVQQACALPMRSGDSVIGVLGIMFSGNAKSIADLLDTLQRYANMASIAINNAQLLQQVHRELSCSQSLLHFAREISHSDCINTLVEKSSLCLIEKFNCASVSVWAVENDVVTESISAWKKSDESPVPYSSSELDVEVADLIASFSGRDSLSRNISNMRLLPMSCVELSATENDDTSVFLCLDQGEAWGLIRITTQGDACTDELALNHMRSALGQMTMAARLHRALGSAQYRADHDELTGLPNRFSIDNFLKENCGENFVADSSLAVFFIDLDGFKAINDTLGHVAGDKLLVSVASRFRSVVNDECLIARMGGDEFVVIACDVDLDACWEIAASLINSLKSSFDLGRKMEVGASIGIRLLQDSNTGPAELLEQADKAMYVAKIKGKNRFQIWSPFLEASYSKNYTDASANRAEQISAARKAV